MGALKKNNKVIRSSSDEIFDNDAANPSKLLHVDFDLQQRNRVFKDGSNLVSQVTDKARNIPFVYKTGNPQFVHSDDGIHYAEFDNGGVVADNINLGYVDSLSIEFWFRTSNKDTTGIRVLWSYNGANGLMLNAYFNDNKIVSNFGTHTFPIVNDTWHHFKYYISNSTLWLFFDGELFAVSATALTPSNDNTFSWGVNYTGSNLCTDIDMKNIILHTDLPELSFSSGDIGTQVFAPKSPFFYYKRYKEDGNKLAYINSRFLQDAVINTSDEISSLKNEIANGVGVVNTVASNFPKYTNKGFLFDGTQDGFKSDGAYSTVTNLENQFFSCWFSPNTITGNQTLMTIVGTGYSIAISVLSTGLFAIYNGISSSNSTITATVGNYYHVAGMKIGTDLYLFVNGILAVITTHSVSSFSGPLICYLGSFDTSLNFINGYADEFFIEHDNLSIDPSTAGIDDRVFDENGDFFRRRGLGNQLTQFT